MSRFLKISKKGPEDLDVEVDFPEQCKLDADNLLELDLVDAGEGQISEDGFEDPNLESGTGDGTTHQFEDGMGLGKKIALITAALTALGIAPEVLIKSLGSQVPAFLLGLVGIIERNLIYLVILSGIWVGYKIYKDYIRQKTGIELTRMKADPKLGPIDTQLGKSSTWSDVLMFWR